MKVNRKNIPEEYKPLVKDDMTMGEVSTLGTVIIKEKMAKLKERFRSQRRRK